MAIAAPITKESWSRCNLFVGFFVSSFFPFPSLHLNLTLCRAFISSVVSLVYRLKLNRVGDVTWELLPILAFT